MSGRGASSAPQARHRGTSQHFLRSAALAEAIVRDAAIMPGDVVVDVGAGTGRLTAPLAERAAHVHAIEIDPALVELLEARFGDRHDVTVVEGDALEVALPNGPFRVVANVPFDGGTAILRRLLDHPSLERADVILEWEATRKRAIPWPSTALGVCWGARYELALVRRLPAGCFEPRPATDGGLLRAIRRSEPLVPAAEHERFCAFVRAAFGRGRPVLSNLAGRSGKRAARELGVSRLDRPRDVDAHQWAALFAAVRPSQ